jgi:hypothetical protein
VRAGAVGNDVDFHVLVPAAVIFDHIGGIVQREVHHLRIVPADPDRHAMGFDIGGQGGCGEGE